MFLRVPGVGAGWEITRLESNPTLLGCEIVGTQSLTLFSRPSTRSSGATLLRATAVAAALSLFGAGAVACNSDSDTQQEQAQQSEVPGIRVQIKDKGQAPLQRIEYTHAAHEQSFTFKATQGLEQRTEGGDAGSDQGISPEDSNVPYDEVTMNLPLEVSAQEIGSGTTNDQRVVRFTAGNPSGTNAERNEDIASAKGFRMETELLASGRPATRSFSAPEGATNSARASVESALTQLTDFPLIFPEDEIGVGARWELTTRVEAAVSMQQVITYTLDKIDGSTLTLGVDVQRSPNVATLAGTNLEIVDSKTTSSGTLTVDLDKTAPTSGNIEVETTLHFGQPNSPVRVIQSEVTRSEWE